MIYAKLLELTIPVVPVAQPRQRHAVRKGKEGRSHVVNYTPEDHPVTAYKAALQLAAGREIKTPLQGPLWISLQFYLPRPASLMRPKSPEHAMPHGKKPDLDNLIKSTQDALKGVAWMDDSQIYGYGETFKAYCEKSGQPRVEIIVKADVSLQQMGA